MQAPSYLLIRLVQSTTSKTPIRRQTLLVPIFKIIRIIIRIISIKTISKLKLSGSPAIPTSMEMNELTKLPNTRYHINKVITYLNYFSHRCIKFYQKQMHSYILYGINSGRLNIYYKLHEIKQNILYHWPFPPESSKS